MDSQQVSRTPPKRAETSFDLLDKLVERFGRMGLLMHGAEVDALYAGLKGITQQTLESYADVADDAACIARANLLRAAAIAHLADGTYAHNQADSTSAAITAPAATNVATASTLIAQLKTTINAHIARKPEHRSVPAYVEAATGNPIDAASNISTLNELLAIWRRHVSSAAPDLEGVGP
ncbi:MAG TPA: hypothetical protein VEJ18_02100 [Planctomycetota bacterium]|nr:hypothetical protein [Planctomycetota bacterium]